MKIHKDIEEWMAAAVTGGLTPEEQRDFEAHLAACPECRALFAEEQKMNTRLQETFARLRPDAQFEQRMVRAFRTAGTGESWRTRCLQALAWLARLRLTQAGVTVLLLLALVRGGALLTGEKITELEATSTAEANGAPEQHAMRMLAGENTYGGSNVVAGGEILGDKPQGPGAMNLGWGLDNKAGIPENRPVSASFALEKGTFDDKSRSFAKREDMNRAPVAAPAAASVAAPVQLGDTFAGGAVGNGGFGGGGGGRGLRNALQSNNGLLAYDTPGVQQQQMMTTDTAPAAAAAAAVDPRKLIRNANLDLEVTSFEKAVETITTLAAGDQGYVATQNSDRGPNGKLQGQIVVKVPPEKLDSLLGELRGLGDLKNQAVGTQDVTKDYYDTAARLRNSQTMEERLLDLLKTQTGKITDMLQVERELARVRGEIEQMQGQLKLYDALVGMATVTIGLHEKDLNQPAAYVQKEQATLALFAPDVDAAFTQAKQIANDAKAQIAQSQLTRDDRGRMAATLSFFVEPEQAPAAILRLKALGRVQNFNDQTQRVARDGSGHTDDAKIERDPVQVDMTIVPDEERTVQQASVSVQTDAVEAKATLIKQAAAAANATVTDATFERAANGAELARLTLRMPMRSYPALLEQIKALGTVKDFTVNRQENAAGGENAPAEIALQIFRPADIVADDNGLGAAMRRTLAQGVGALLWSVRMIGVSLAFLAPWAVGVVILGWVFFRRRRKA